MTFFQRLTKPKLKPPTEAEITRARIEELTAALNERRPTGTPKAPPLRLISSKQLENELSDTGEEDTPPRGSR